MYMLGYLLFDKHDVELTHNGQHTDWELQQLEVGAEGEEEGEHEANDEDDEFTAALRTFAGNPDIDWP